MFYKHVRTATVECTEVCAEVVADVQEREAKTLNQKPYFSQWEAELLTLLEK